MKTVHEYLCEIDSDELANQYMVDFPPDDLEWLSHKDMRIGEYYDLRKQAIRKFIDKLRYITPCTTEDGEKKSSSNNLPAHSVGSFSLPETQRGFLTKST